MLGRERDRERGRKGEREMEREREGEREREHLEEHQFTRYNNSFLILIYESLLRFRSSRDVSSNEIHHISSHAFKLLPDLMQM